MDTRFLINGLLYYRKLHTVPWVGLAQSKTEENNLLKQIKIYYTSCVNSVHFEAEIFYVTITEICIWSKVKELREAFYT